MNPLYQQLMGGGMQGVSQPSQTRLGFGGMQFQNPVQRMQYFLQAMRNPAAFVKQNLPGVPEQAYSDPTGNQVLQYMMNNMGVTQQDIQNAANQAPRF